jgi:hypothetical protein
LFGALALKFRGENPNRLLMGWQGGLEWSLGARWLRFKYIHIFFHIYSGQETWIIWSLCQLVLMFQPGSCRFKKLAGTGDGRARWPIKLSHITHTPSVLNYKGFDFSGYIILINHISRYSVYLSA